VSFITAAEAFVCCLESDDFSGFLAARVILDSSISSSIRNMVVLIII
jgi:hypothetical protein